MVTVKAWSLAVESRTKLTIISQTGSGRGHPRQAARRLATGVAVTATNCQLAFSENAYHQQTSRTRPTVLKNSPPWCSTCLRSHIAVFMTVHRPQHAVYLP